MWYIIIGIIIILIILMSSKTTEIQSQSKSLSVSDVCATIVEPRAHPHLEYVLTNFSHHLPSEVNLILFHGKAAKEYVHSLPIVKQLLAQKRLKLVKMARNNLKADEYNKYLKSGHFWQHINKSKVLVFQTDSVLCSQSPFVLQDFLHLDYVGARTLWSNNFGGNGGLSLRDTKLSKLALKMYAKKNKSPEDVFFPKYIHKLGGRIATKEEQDKFSTQNYFTQKSFGAHKVNSLLPKKLQPKFKAYCPEYLAEMP